MKPKRGHYCRICGRRRANERFSGKGHRIHVCKDCARMPREEREAIEQADEIEGFFFQSRISEKNVARLEQLMESSNARVRDLAELALEVARVRPYKKRRMKILSRERRDLLRRLEELGLIVPYW